MKIKVVLLCLIIISISSLVTNYVFWKRNSPLPVVSVRAPNVKETLVVFGKNEVVISPQSVVINEGFESHNPLSIVIDTKNYPDLFSPENEFARLHIEQIASGKLQNINLIRISRQIPNHGSMADSYFIVFDPTIGKVVDTGWTHTFGTVYLFSSCMSCALPMLEFTEYDQKQAKYVLTNSDHKKEFQQLLQQHMELQKKEMCRINGVDMTIAKALQTAKDGDKCADQVLGISNNNPADDFITIGQYKSILINIQKVINGENITIFERI